MLTILDKPDSYFSGIKSFAQTLLSCGILLLFSLKSTAVDLSTFEHLEQPFPIPRFQALGINADTLDKLANQKITVLVNSKQDLELSSAKKGKTFTNARIVTAMTIIDAPVDKVKGVVKDYENYTNVMPRTEKASIIKQYENHHWVEYLLTFKLPVWAIKIKYLFQYTEEDNGDITVQLLEGGGESGASRWEFIPLSHDRTLLVFSNWNDLENSGFFFKTLVQAQPDLKITIPIISATIAVDAIKKQFPTKPLMPIGQLNTVGSSKNKKILPQVPYYDADEVEAISQLTGFGMVLVLHPLSDFRDSFGSTKLEYISVIKKVNVPVNASKILTTNFESYVDFLPPLVELDHRKTKKGFETDWYLKLKFGLLALPIEYSMNYAWLGENYLYFYLTQGDIESVYGSLQWYPFKNQQAASLFSYTLAIDIGDDLPVVLSILNKIPRRSLLSGIFMGAMFMENQSQWIEAQIVD